MEIINHQIPKEMEALIKEIQAKYKDNHKLQEIFEKAFINTYQTTIKKQEDGTTFVITGDIDAMWNRDSAAQVRPMLNLVKQSKEIREIILGVMQRHKEQILYDPYANAHNLEPKKGDHATDDLTNQKELVWERKYEIDSLCYPIELAYLYYKQTADSVNFDDKFLEVLKTIVKIFKIEQHHHEQSTYSFRRIADWLLFDYPERIPFETLNNHGKGAQVTYTGMTWSGFRPSDDACKYGYLIPANMFAHTILGYMEEIISKFYQTETDFCQEIDQLKNEINMGIQKYGIIDHPKYGKIYAYEVDGLGNYNLMDDANVPSLLSIPYLGYTTINDPIYQNTRKFLLSEDNPYYYEGQVAKGIGSPHTPANHFWHIALAIQGMTTNDYQEKQDILAMFLQTTGGTNLMHEGIDVDNPQNFTRPWFSWANSMFCEFILELNNISVTEWRNNEI
ncbi:MAG: glycoside hydrolase family 125 protein [Mycoplasmatales bacterium]